MEEEAVTDLGVSDEKKAPQTAGYPKKAPAPEASGN